MFDATEEVENGCHLGIELAHEITRGLLGQRRRVLVHVAAAQDAPHRDEYVLGVEVRVRLAALGALELRPSGELVLVVLDLDSDAVEFVLDDVHEHFVVDVEVAVLRLFAVCARLH